MVFLSRHWLVALVALLSHLQCVRSAGTVNLANKKQTIDGFGGSTAWLGILSDTAANTLFGTGNGQLGMTILRLRIDPGGPSKWGEELANAKKAKAHGAKVMATPWTPQASMKTNNNVVSGSLKTDQYANYANYLKSFVQYFSSNGASIYTISVNNEPDIKVTYESCDWTPQQLRDFVKKYGASIGTKLMASESYNFNRASTDLILKDATAASRVSIIGGHIYGNGMSDYPLARSKGKSVWMTEHFVDGVDFKSALDTAKEILDCLAVANFNAYLYWWLFQPSYAKQDTNGFITQSGAATKRGYFAAQFARFIRPGATRVDATYNLGNNVFMGAFKSGNSVVLVVVNTGWSASSQQITISGGTVKAFNVYITSNNLNLAQQGKVTVNGGKFTYNFQPESATTLVSA